MTGSPPPWPASPSAPDARRNTRIPATGGSTPSPTPARNAVPASGWPTPGGRELGRDAEAIRQAARALTQGGIVALKGLGGFHLACDATSTRAVLELRARKARPHKPLAVMTPDLESARALARITDGEARLLAGVERPIVLCRMLDRTPLSPELSPDAPFVGLMLPYTPLHHVLFALYRELLPPETTAALVMTSGNRRAEPIVLGNREALDRLGGIADLFLLHDRDILVRTDDSVLRLPPGHPAGQFLRRARGFTPSPVFLASPGPPVLGLGPQLKNTVCLTREDQAFVSQHIGDLENLETFAFFEEVIDHLRRILQVRPQALIRDLHPDYLSTRYALEQAELPVFALQHHFAHIHAVLAEHRVEGPALGLALDGAGYGGDGTIWGGEALFVDSRTLEHARLGHLSPAPLPGGEAAIREPWRMAVSYLRELGSLERGIRPWPWEDEHGRDAERLIQVLDQGINSPPSTSAGRLFDAVAALLGLSTEVTYEGQAAVLLEGIQHGVDAQPYPCPVLESRHPRSAGYADPLFPCAGGLAAGRGPPGGEPPVPPGTDPRSGRPGRTAGRPDAGVRTVALSGGVMQNLTVSVELPRMLVARGLTPLVHVHTPPNDGCISLGQAAWGRRACTD